MSHASLHVLLVDDDDNGRATMHALLVALGHRVESVPSGQAALARLAVAPPPDVVIMDVMMTGLDGIETVRRYRVAGGAVPVVMLSAMGQADTVVQAMRAGATDYVTKPIDREELSETLARVVDLRPMRAGTSTSVIQGATRTGRPLGVSAAMRRVEALIDRVADADVPILITGESGVGKDVVARELHARSNRRDRVFVKINCAALPESLLESELFGYERGAFTGAQRAKPGQFELADGGTLFLDEIGEMPSPLQAKLLQALQDGEFYRVGGQKKVRVDVRIIVATNRDLERAIREGTFREDLYYRLNVVNVRIPPLRERREDIPDLLAHFVAKYGQRYGRSAADVPSDVVARFMGYDWPGNVRELENLVRRLMVLRDPSYVYAEMKIDGAGLAAAENVLPLRPLQVEPAPVLPPAPATVPPGGAGPRDLDAPAPARAPLAGAAAMPAPPLIPAPSPPLLATSHPFLPSALPAPPPPAPARGGSYPFGGYASDAAATPLGEVVAAEFAAAGESGRVDLKALGRKASEIAEREAIIAMLARTGGSKREAADRLGISYKAILYKIREFGIGKPRTPRRPTTPGEPVGAAPPAPDRDGTEPPGLAGLDTDDDPPDPVDLDDPDDVDAFDDEDPEHSVA